MNASLTGSTFRDELTGAKITPVASSDSAWIFVGQEFSWLPVALLVSR